MIARRFNLQTVAWGLLVIAAMTAVAGGRIGGIVRGTLTSIETRFTQGIQIGAQQ